MLVLEGLLFVIVLLERDALRAASLFQPEMLAGERCALMEETGIGLWGVPLAILGGAIRVSTPFLFVSLGECITEKSGRINLGLEGTLVFGAMSAYGVAYETSSAWAGVLAAGIAGAAFGAFHGWICKFPRVNDIAVGIALMLFGMGLAFFFGKPYIQPVAPDLPAIPLGFWSDIPQVQAALRVNVLFLIGIALAGFLWWAFRNTKHRPRHPHRRRQRRRRARHGLQRRCGAAAGRPPRAASWPASPAPICRSTIPAAGTRASPPGRA